MDFNIWIDVNKQNLDYTINLIMDFLNKYNKEFNYDINEKLPSILASYIYNNSSNKNDSIH
jgi:hypothetical protein